MLNSPRDLENFQIAAAELLDSPWEIIGFDSRIFSDIINAMDNVQNLASILTLSLIIMIIIYERRYELGVYLSLGASKTKLINQLLIEISYNSGEGNTRL